MVFMWSSMLRLARRCACERARSTSETQKMERKAAVLEVADPGEQARLCLARGPYGAGRFGILRENKQKGPKQDNARQHQQQWKHSRRGTHGNGASL